MLGGICRQFRIANHIKLREIEGSPNIKTLSGFEMGINLSSKHFMKYVRYALEHNLYNDLTMRIAEGVSKGGEE
ncbi:hypothetical protein [Salmonella enterica]